MGGRPKGPPPTTDIAVLKEYLSYDAEAGKFTWLKSSCNRPLAGRIAGGKMTHGYVCVAIFGKRFLAHRLAWAFVYNEWPTGEIDHINRIRDDNRLVNLRRATRQQNASNSPTHKRNKLGVKGVGKKRNKYLARLWNGERDVVLGRFNTIEEAKACYDAAIVKLRGEFSSTG